MNRLKINVYTLFVFCSIFNGISSIERIEPIVLVHGGAGTVAQDRVMLSIISHSSFENLFDRIQSSQESFVAQNLQPRSDTKLSTKLEVSSMQLNKRSEQWKLTVNLMLAMAVF